MNIYELIAENIEKISDHFNLGLYPTRKYYGGKCPIHDGDNPSAFSFYTEGNTCIGNWRCHTHQCHEKWGGHSLGFMQGLLSVRDDREYTKDAARIWCEDFFKQKSVVSEKTSDDTLTSFIHQFQHKKEEPTFRMKTADFHSRLKAPTYYLERDYKEDTLNKFKVGYCDNPSKPMYQRVLVPIFDNNNADIVVGFMGRSIYEKCILCKGHHAQNGMCAKIPNPKWRNSDLFPSESSLYNFTYAKKFIDETGIAVLVEGSPNVWRCDEAGFPMAMGCYGAKFTDYQKNLLDTTGAHTIIGVPDNDEASEIFVKHIRAQCKYTHNIVIIEPSFKDDIGKCNVETVKTLLGPIVEKYNA